MSDAFTLLKMDFPIWTIRNRQPTSAILAVAGDDIQAPPEGVIRVRASTLHQIPDLKTFELISPTLHDLIHYGVIQSRGSAKPQQKSMVPAESPTEVKTKSDKPIDSLSNKR